MPGGAVSGDAAITGTVYRDANSNGTKDAHDAGQAGVTVTATDTTGTQISTVSAADGSYSLGVAALGAGPFRIEFSNWPANLRPAPHGTDDPTSVSNAAAGAKVNFGVLDPEDYCQANPNLAVSCFVAGVDGAADLETLATFPYKAGTTETSAHDASRPGPVGFDQPAATKLASLGQTGSIYGEGWHAQSSSLYLGAFAKKYVPFGGSGSGAIYVRHGAGAPTLFYTTGSTTDRTPPGGDWYQDPWTDQVGKVGWGDIDVMGNRAYAVNLEDRNLYVFDLDPATGNLVGTGPVAKVAIPAVATAADDSRPFGLGNHDGVVYVGGVDSGQTSGAVPSAWVLRFDPATNTFVGGPVTQFPLGFNRGCAYVAKTILSGNRCSAVDGYASWRAWGTQPSSADTPDINAGQVIRTQVDPQPILSDLVFDDNGDMTLGFRDRWGDQSGRYIPAGTVPNPISPALGNFALLLNTYSFGDTLRAARTSPTTWQLESNGASGGVTGTANTGMGPGGGEFYGADNSLYNVDNFGVPTLEGHDEVTMGGLVHLPSSPEVATTAYDVFGRWDTLGVRFLTDTGKDAPKGADSTDLNVRAYALYRGTLGGTTPFGKANGLGDLEALCDQAPLELGNYVWYDADRDGVQDPTEKPIPGVKVNLLDATGTVLATAITDAGGQYWFVSAGAPNLPASPDTSYGLVPGGVLPNTKYSMTFDSAGANTAALGIPASALTITIAKQGSPTTDSDPVSTDGGLPTLGLTTGGPGSNDHTFDAGYSSEKAPRISLVKSVNGNDANTAPGPTVDAGSTVTFTYLITNTGDLTLTAVALADDRIGAINCPKTTLLAGESETCSATAVAITGRYTNIGTVTGTAPDGSLVSAKDPANYIGQQAVVLGSTTIVGDNFATTTTAVPSVVQDSSSARPAGSLARTGANDGGLTTAGTGLVIAGLGLLLTSRRRRKA